MNTHRTHQKLFKNGLLFGALYLDLVYQSKKQHQQKLLRQISMVRFSVFTILIRVNMSIQ
ncbi:hypothetical protein QK910_01115 [Lactococcus cremoris]|uniref:hypothetical protein n=1 Tax=Lactococcus lactis subsp. cremoris TaxID=1359 RepID=UPI003A8043DE